jgi:hypothetical protein
MPETVFSIFDTFLGTNRVEELPMLVFGKATGT